MAKTHWVFGYGSLMWRPGFEFVSAQPAKIFGFSRSLCVHSYHYRGSEKNPGLVMGLKSGGSCHGIAFEVAEENWPETLQYLRDREQVTMVYREIAVVLHFVDQRPSTSALTYAVDIAHDQYAGDLKADEIFDLIRHGEGVSGTCMDYVRNTLAHLRTHNIHDCKLELIGRELKL